MLDLPQHIMMVILVLLHFASKVEVVMQVLQEHGHQKGLLVYQPVNRLVLIRRHLMIQMSKVLVIRSKDFILVMVCLWLIMH